MKPGIKNDPEKRWALPDRVFFGHGACHILAGTYLNNTPLQGFYAERIIPKRGFLGNHIFVTDGCIAFDYHGYSIRKKLLSHFRNGWSSKYIDWDCELEIVKFDLLSTPDLNERKMLGPDQYLFDPIARAVRFINSYDHSFSYDRAIRSISEERCKTGQGPCVSPACDI